MTPAAIQADAAWFWKREAYHAGRAAFEREFNKDEAAARRHDIRSAAFRACALKADEACASTSSNSRKAA